MKKVIRIAALVMALAMLWSLSALAETKTATLTYADAYAHLGEVPYGTFSAIDYTFGPGVSVHADQGSIQYGSFNLYVYSSGDKAVTFTAPDGWAIQSISGIGSGSTYPVTQTAGNLSHSGKNWQWTAPDDNGMKQVTFKGAVTSSGEKVTAGADINITNFYAGDENTLVEIVLTSVVGPETGDTTMPALWFCLMLASAASILALRKRAR